MVISESFTRKLLDDVIADITILKAVKGMLAAGTFVYAIATRLTEQSQHHGSDQGCLEESC